MKNALREIAFMLAKKLYHIARRLIGPAVSGRLRTRLLGARIRDAFREYLKPSAFTQQGSVSPALPAFIVEDSMAIHNIDPMIFPDQNIRNYNFIGFLPDHPYMGQHYMKFRELAGEGISHMFIIPWIKQGGADLATLSYVRTVLERGFASGVLVVSTEDSASAWSGKLHKDARFIEFGVMCNDISAIEQEKLLARIILQMRPSMVHIINSDLGYRVLEKYGKTLASSTRTVLSIFCADFLRNGRMVGYATRVSDVWDVVSNVYFDNAYWAGRISSLYALERDKIHVHYQPVDIGGGRIKTLFDRNKQGLDILWAGRIDYQKRPDILIEIARKCKDMPYTFHVYGTPVYGTTIDEIRKFMDDFASLPNVKCMGAFDGTRSLPIDKFDVFLYTSQWDGIPIVLLEAMSLGLPIVASSVGGVPEVVIEGQTGFLVNPYDDVPMYVSRLMQLAADRSLLKTFSDNAYALVCERHNMDSFVRSLKDTNYVQPDSSGMNP